jgi:hypothetical protein
MAGTYPSKAPVECSTLRKATLKHYTRLEKTAGDKRSSLIVPFVSYEEESFVHTPTDPYVSQYWTWVEVTEGDKYARQITVRN